MQRVYSLLVDNNSGVLSRISGLFTRRGYNIDSITAGVTADPRFTRITIVSSGDEIILSQIEKQIAQLKESGDIEDLLHGRWAHMEELDEDEWLEHLEEHLKEIVNISGKEEHTLAMQIEEHRKQVHDRIAKNHPELAERFKERRHVLDTHLKERHPKVYELVLQSREKNERNR